MDKHTTTGGDSLVMRWSRRLPIVRAYPALQDARDELRQARQKIKTLTTSVDRAEREAAQARELVRQREAAVRSLDAGGLQLLAAPAFDHDRVAELARHKAAAYRTADPFPHIVEDGLFHAEMLDAVAHEFASMERGNWHQSNAARERKWSMEDSRQLGPFTLALIAQLNSGVFINILEALTGIEGLVADPHLRGGGLHEIQPGGLLGVHADFNVHPRLKLYRRLNLLVYLNRDWDERWGGALELWDREGRHSVRSIAPLFNRTVLFDTTNFSYHGHPHPLACPPDRARRSVALYYYTQECPTEQDTTPHGTIFIDAAK